MGAASSLPIDTFYGPPPSYSLYSAGQPLRYPASPSQAGDRYAYVSSPFPNCAECQARARERARQLRQERGTKKTEDSRNQPRWHSKETVAGPMCSVDKRNVAAVSESDKDTFVHIETGAKEKKKRLYSLRKSVMLAGKCVGKAVQEAAERVCRCC